MPHTILIADDEKEIVDLLRLYLEKDGDTVVEAGSGTEALDRVAAHKVDLAIIDVMMPGMDGYGLIRKIRQTLTIPVIFLSAKSQDHDKILGLGLGADDYITKPFNPLEVVARVRAQLRRYNEYHPVQTEPTEPRPLQIGAIALHKDSCTVYRQQQELALTSTEFKLLCYLMENAG